jgi:hypothetical protein
MPSPTKLSCRRCLRTGRQSTVRVERGVQKRRYHGKLRACVDVLCSNGHEWWSVSKIAIARSRKRDERASEKLP